MIEEGPFDGNTTQRALIEESIAEAMLYRIKEKRVQPEIPAPLKWAAAIIAAILTGGSLAMAVWLVSSVSTMRETLARMDERQVMTSAMLADRFQAIDSRLARLEEKGIAR